MSAKAKKVEAADEAERIEVQRFIDALLLRRERVIVNGKERMTSKQIVPVTDDELSSAREKIEQMGLSHSELIDYAAREAAAGEKLIERVSKYEFIVGIFEAAKSNRDWPNIFKTHYSENIVAQALLKAMGLQRVITAGQGARGKANGKAGIAKAEAKRLWGDWQAGKMLHKSQAAFARYVVDNVPDLVSPKNVEAWCTTWGKELKLARQLDSQ
jgi:hypothetical protein